VIRLWNFDTGLLRELHHHQGLVNSLDVTSDGRHLASASADRSAVLWELATGEPRVLRGPRQQAHLVLFSPDDRRLAVASYTGQLRYFSMETKLHRVLSAGAGPQVSLVLSSNGQRLATMSEQGVLRLLHASSGRSLQEVPGLSPEAMGFSPDGQWLAAGGVDGRIHLYASDTGSERPLPPGHGARVTAVTFSGKGPRLATADAHGEIWLWEPGTAQGRRLGTHGTKVWQLAFSPRDGSLASAGDNGEVRLWNVATGAFRSLPGLKGAVHAMAISPDGEHLVMGGVDQLAFLDLRSGQRIEQDTKKGDVLELRYSPGGDVVASRDLRDGNVMLWDGRTGAPRTLSRKHQRRGHQGDVLGLAFSPDGTRLASASLDKTVRLWDLATGESRALRGHIGPVAAVAFFPDGKTLVSTGQDGTLRLWPDNLPLEPEALREWMNGFSEDRPSPENSWP
jgi:eukaryotic-like serine/threonine-protein kinase